MHEQTQEIEFDSVKSMATYTVKKYILSAYSGTVLGMLFLMGIVLPGLLSKETTLAAIFKIVIFAVMAMLPCAFFLHENKQGRFVLAANEYGLFYRSCTSPTRAVFIPWNLVKKISSIIEDGFRVVQINLKQGICIIPEPCNGETWVENHRGQLSFQVGLGNRIGVVVGNLNALKKLQYEQVLDV